MALSLRVARKVVSEKASDRLDKEELWTEGRLRDVIQARLGEKALYLVSNREPYMHIIDEATGKPRCIRPAGGVVTAIDPIMRACGGMWIAHGSGNADRQFVNSKDKLGVPPEDIGYILKRVWLSKEEEEGYYYGFANEGLWPLCHITHTRPIFRESDWQTYQQVNQKFADSVLEELPARNPFVFIQDYHFTLLAKMIKDKRPDATVALFWHIPWPNPEVFATCPYHEQILDGMLACDLIGFHVQMHCNNFLDTANRLLESRVDTETFSVVRLGKETAIRSFPISVDDSMDRELSDAEQEPDRPDSPGISIWRARSLPWGWIGSTIPKGCSNACWPWTGFSRSIPNTNGDLSSSSWRLPAGRTSSVTMTSRPRWMEWSRRSTGSTPRSNWRPILYFKRHFSQEEIRPYYALADICIVSSLHDGMNLVAKEYVAAKTDLNGVLILSRFTGAARELTQAVLVNPYSTEEFADSIKLAAEMPAEEKRRPYDADAQYRQDQQCLSLGRQHHHGMDGLEKVTCLRKRRHVFVWVCLLLNSSERPCEKRLIWKKV